MPAPLRATSMKGQCSWLKLNGAASKPAKSNGGGENAKNIGSASEQRLNTVEKVWGNKIFASLSLEA